MQALLLAKKWGHGAKYHVWTRLERVRVRLGLVRIEPHLSSSALSIGFLKKLIITATQNFTLPPRLPDPVLEATEAERKKRLHEEREEQEKEAEDVCIIHPTKLLS